MQQPATGEQRESLRVALLAKNDMLGIFSLGSRQGKIRVASFDNRMTVPSTHDFDELPKALFAFDDRLQATVQNGWTVFYDGPPLLG